MNEGTGFAAFALYNALKLHFTSSSYDYFKYNGKTNVSKDSFLKRKDKYTFYKLSRKYQIEELKQFYIANFLDGDKWVGNMNTTEGEEQYQKWQKRQQSLTYTFQNDIMYMLDKVNDPNDLLIVKNNEFPKLMQYVTQGDISLETLVIMNNIMNFFPMWNKEIYDDIIWPDFKMRCEKYAPFIYYDKKKFKEILKEKIKEYA
jgi:hypothetical protein